MVIGAHPADVFDQAGGILGITDIHTLGRDDDLEVLTQDLVIDIGEKLRQVRPDLIITHHPHQDGGYKFHATVGQATLYAFRYADGAGRSKTRPHLIRSIYLMSPSMVHGACGLGDPGIGHPEIYVDITDVVDKKIEALNCIQSQYYSGRYALKRAEMVDGRHGQKARVAYAEQFQRFFPWVCNTLPTSDFDLLVNEEPMARMSYVVSLDMPRPPHYRPGHFRFDRDLYR